MTKITNKEFISNDFGQPAIDALKEILSLTDDLIGTLKKVGKESEGALEGLDPAKSVKDSNKLNDILEKLLKTETELAELQKDKKKVVSDLKKLEDQKLKTDKEALAIAVKSTKAKQEEQKLLLAEKRTQSQALKNSTARRKERERQFKAREKERKQRTKQLTEYQKESRRLNELRNSYKDLAVAEKENTKEAKALLKEITALDKKLKEIDESVGQNQRSVGNYEKALNGLNSGLAKLGIVAAVTKGFELLGSAFGDTREGALQLQILFSKFTETSKVFINNLIDSGEGLKNIFAGIVAPIEASLLRQVLAIKKVQEALSFGDTAKRLQGEIAAIEERLVFLDKPLITEGVEKVKKAFEGTVQTTSKAIKEQEKFLRLQLETRIQIQQQEKALAGLAEQRQILQDISDDDTIGFVTRTKAVEKAQKAAVDFAKQENELALLKEKLTIEAVKQDLRRAKVLNESQLQAIKTGEQLQAILEDEAKARKVSDANDEAFSAAFIERVNKQVESEAFARDQEEKNTKTARDAFEQELDILEEFTEKRVASNEKIISSDSATLQERQKALLENEKLEKELFDESIKRIFAQAKASIDLRKDLTQAEKDQQKALIDTADIQKILNTQDEQERFNLIRSLDLGEIEEKRLKDSLKIKQDIAIVNKESLKVEEEAARKTIELQAEISIQEKKIANESFDLDKAKLDSQKKNLNERISLLKKDSIERLQLEKQLNDLLIQEQGEKLDKETQKTEEAAEKRADAIQTAATLATDFIQKNNEKRLKNIDDTLTGIEERQSSLRAAAEQGNEQAVKSLAESERQEAEVRAQKEKELKRQQRIEAGLAAFQVFAANAENDPNTALSKTFTDITALSAFISSLPSFYSGTEDTGTVANALDQNGGRLSVLHDNERVITAEQNKKIGNISNEELARIAVDHKRGTFRQFENVTPSSGPLLVQNNNESLKAEMNELIKAVKANKQGDPVQSFDKRTGVLKEVVKTGMKINNTHKQLFYPKRKR